MRQNKYSHDCVGRPYAKLYDIFLLIPHQSQLSGESGVMTNMYMGYVVKSEEIGKGKRRIGKVKV